MKCCLFLLLPLLVPAQVAKEANERYRTKEGRAGIAQTLDRPDRDQTQKPRELVDALDLRPGMTVADIGAGVGYLLPLLSRAVAPGGRVIAEDIFEDFLNKARQKVEREKLANVEFVQGSETDPNLPANAVDLALALDSYHHWDYPETMLAGLRRALKPGGRLVIVDFYKRRGAMGPNDPDRALQHIRVDQDQVIQEVERAGFRLFSKREHVPASQYMLVFERT